MVLIHILSFSTIFKNDRRLTGEAVKDFQDLDGNKSPRDGNIIFTYLVITIQ